MRCSRPGESAQQRVGVVAPLRHLRCEQARERGIAQIEATHQRWLGQRARRRVLQRRDVHLEHERLVGRGEEHARDILQQRASQRHPVRSELRFPRIDRARTPAEQRVERFAETLGADDVAIAARQERRLEDRHEHLVPGCVRDVDVDRTHRQQMHEFIARDAGLVEIPREGLRFTNDGEARQIGLGIGERVGRRGTAGRATQLVERGRTREKRPRQARPNPAGGAYGSDRPTAGRLSAGPTASALRSDNTGSSWYPTCTTDPSNRTGRYRRARYSRGCRNRRSR